MLSQKDVNMEVSHSGTCGKVYSIPEKVLQGGEYFDHFLLAFDYA